MTGVHVEVRLTAAQAEAVLNAVGFDNGRRGTRVSRNLQEAYERIAAAIVKDMERKAALAAVTCSVCGLWTDKARTEGGKYPHCVCGGTSKDGEAVGSS